MSERITFWKCRHCHGTGRVFRPWYAEKSEPCFECGETGNAFVDGAAEAHKRRLEDEGRNKLMVAAFTASADQSSSRETQK